VTLVATGHQLRVFAQLTIYTHTVDALRARNGRARDGPRVALPM